MCNIGQEEANPCRDPLKDGIVWMSHREILGVEINWKIQNHRVVNKGAYYMHKEPLKLNKKKVPSLKGMSLPKKEASYHDLSHSPNVSLLDYACLQFRMK
jgi:hypothetical protein